MLSLKFLRQNKGNIHRKRVLTVVKSTVLETIQDTFVPYVTLHCVKNLVFLIIIVINRGYLLYQMINNDLLTKVCCLNFSYPSIQFINVERRS